MISFILIELSKRKKSTGTFEMSFSCFGPFEVWGMTPIILRVKTSFGLPATTASQPRTNCLKDISFLMRPTCSAFRTSKAHSTFLEIALSSHLSGTSSQIITITPQPNFIIKLYVWMVNYYFKPLSFYN